MLLQFLTVLAMVAIKAIQTTEIQTAGLINKQRSAEFGAIKFIIILREDTILFLTQYIV